MQVSGDIWLIAADVAEEEYTPELIEQMSADIDWLAVRAGGHQEVIAACAQSWPTVPLRLFTLFRDERSAVDAMSGNAAQIDRALERIAGNDEWAVRVFYAGAEEAAPVDGSPSGTAFLRRKQEARQAVRRQLELALSAVEVLFADLARVSVDSRRRPPAAREKGARLMLLDAAILLDRARIADLQSLIERFTVEHPECEANVTGPWPAYSFAARAPEPHA